MGPAAITVLIPAYNAAGTIEATLYSVLNQTESDFEIVVADDGSTDDTLAIVDRVREKSLQGEKIVSIALSHGGCAHVTHQGIIRCNTDVVTILDSDDLLYRRALEVVLSEMGESVCYLWTRFVHSKWEDREHARLGWAKDLPAGYPTLKETFLRTGWWGGSHQRVFRRSVYLEETPGLDQKWQTAVDLQLCLRMAGTGRPTKSVNSVTYWYRRSRTQMSHTSRTKQRAAHKEMLVEWREKHSGK